MQLFLKIFLISLDHCSYDSIAKRQEQYVVFSVLISPVSDRGKNTSLCYSQLPFLYIKGPHQSFPRTSHWELMLSDVEREIQALVLLPLKSAENLQVCFH